jgi:hypothetical protein
VSDKFCELFGHDLEDLSDYDFFASHSSAVVLPVGEVVFVDVSQIGAKIEQILGNLQIDERMQHEKGAAFERVVADYIRGASLDGIGFPIGDSQELFLKGANVPFAEADVYVAKGNILFVIDCKACGVSRRYLKGDALDVRRRWNKILTWLAESDTRVSKIAQQPTGANYSIGSEIKYLVPIVCSSMPEYFWEWNESLSLSECTPRVCTVSELRDVLERSASLNLESRPYTVAVQGHDDRVESV